MVQGHTVLYRSRHRSMEQGKDVITKDESGCFHAYQLKTGNINQGTWRNIKGEIDALMQLPIVHPSVQKDDGHCAYLVCNGEITDEVRNEIDLINEDNKRKQRNYAYLDVITITKLLDMFIHAQGEFLPNSIEDFNAFLNLYLSDGCDFINKTSLAQFLTSSILMPSIEGKANQIHAVSSSVVIWGHLLKPFQEKENYLALFEAWGLLASAIVVFAEIHKVRSDWQASLTLATEEAVSSLHHLKNETLDREDFLEGDLIGDGDLMYSGRTTAVLGVLAFLELHLVEMRTTCQPDDRIVTLIDRNVDKLWVWGESAIPYLLNMVWVLEKAGKTDTAEVILTKTFTDVLKSNSREHVGLSPLASPYYSLSDVLETLSGFSEEPIDFESFTTSSYSLDVLIQTIARRQHRLLLELNWRRATHIHVQEFVPEREIEMLSWRVKKGKNSGYDLPQTQSRKALIQESKIQPEGILTRYKILLHMFTLIAPHRMTTNTAAIIDPMVESV